MNLQTSGYSTGLDPGSYISALPSGRPCLKFMSVPPVACVFLALNLSDLYEPEAREKSMRGVLVLSTVALFAALLSSGNSNAAEITIQPRLEAGVMYYQFDREDQLELIEDVITGEEQLGGDPGFEVEDALPFVGGGLTLDYDRFLLDVSGQITTEGNDDFSQPISLPLAGEQETFIVSFDSEFDHREAAATLGYRLTDAHTVIGGYRYVNVEFENTNELDTVTEEKYTYHGPFIGVRYSLPVENFGGGIQFTTAITYLVADVEIAIDGRDSPEGEGESIGFDFAVIWFGQITKNLGYTIGADATRYDFEGDNVADFKETSYRLRASLGYTFGVGS